MPDLSQAELRDLVLADADPRRVVAMGLPVPCGTVDPAVYKMLPGVGVQRAAALADAADAGRLTREADILRIHGFGTKMAARIAPLIQWCATADGLEPSP
jgi:hypothetical protein